MSDKTSNRGASREPEDEVVTGGEASGGGTPTGGGSQSSEPGMNGGIVGGSDETNMASKAFGGSTTGYGKQDMETDGANSGTTFGGGSAGGLATGNPAQGGGSPGGQTSGGGHGSNATGMVVGGGTEGSVDMIDSDDLMFDSNPRPEAGASPKREDKHIHSSGGEEISNDLDNGAKTGGRTVDG